MRTCEFHPRGCPRDCLVSDPALELEYRGAILTEESRRETGDPLTFPAIIDRLLNFTIPRRIERRTEAEWIANEIREGGGSLRIRHGRLVVDLGSLPDELMDGVRDLRAELEEIAVEMAH